eukprot:766544-Hanusia_phi.AAC.1
MLRSILLAPPRPSHPAMVSLRVGDELGCSVPRLVATQGGHHPGDFFCICLQGACVVHEAASESEANFQHRLSRSTQLLGAQLHGKSGRDAAVSRQSRQPDRWLERGQAPIGAAPVLLEELQG